MEKNRTTYEAMFLLDAGQPNPDTAIEGIRTVLERSEAEILAIKPWEERRLAYEIQGRKRGLYILSYFRLSPEKVTELEHDCMLNENILRVLILRKDHLTEQEINAQTPAMTAPSEPSEPSGGVESAVQNREEIPEEAVTESTD
jgi:small subunit ribosomal protein S6